MRNSVWKKMALLAFIWVFAAASCLSAYAGDFKLAARLASVLVTAATLSTT